MRRLVHLSVAVAGVLALVSCSHDQAATPPTTQAALPQRQSVRATSPAITTTVPAVATPAAAAPTAPAAPPATPPATSPPSTVATTAPPLPTPVAPPLEDGTREETHEVGTIEIPRTGLRAPIYEGIRLSTLDRGPGHWPGSAMPGEAGNVVVAGHRTSHNAEFRHLDELVNGDEVIMHTPAGAFVYRVTSTEIVPPDALWIVDQTPARTATLFACHPPGSVRERIVVRMELVA
jgi:sortase A